MTVRIGLLWDNLTPNTGDQAIGLTLLRLARQAGFGGIEPVKLEPGYSTRFDLLIIGGGELLQPEGDPFYDAFRVPGRHILNTVGTSGEVQAGHLDNYRLVSVRSEADRKNLRGVSREVVVAPCLTVLFDSVAETVDAPSLPEGTIGIHASPASVDLDRLSEIPALCDRLGTAARFFSFTRYNQDWHVARAILGGADTPEVLHLADSDLALATIRQMRAVICTSLHATIFAYVTGTPFVSIAYSPKVVAFLEERDLAERAAPTLATVAERLDLLEPDRVDWNRQLTRDRDDARSYLDSLLDELVRASPAPTVASTVVRGIRRARKGTGLALDTDAPDGRWREPTHPREAHRLEMSIYREYGLRVADAIAARKYTLQLEAAYADADRRGKDVEELHQRLEGYARELEDLAGERQRALEEAEAYVRKLEKLARGDSAEENAPEESSSE